MPADAVVEDVPFLRRRYGDYVIQGSNNTTIIMGTDRAKKGPATVDDGLGHVDASGKGKGTGTIHLIAGRVDKKGDPDHSKDEAFIYITRKSKVDDNLDLGGVESAENDAPAVVLKSDLVRVVGRKSIKVCANDDSKHYMFLSGDKVKINFNDNATIEIVDKKVTIKMGSSEFMMSDSEAHVNVSSTKLKLDGSTVTIDAPSFVLKGGAEQKLKSVLDDLKSFYTDYASHQHTTAMGPSSPPVPPSVTTIATGPADIAQWNT